MHARYYARTWIVAVNLYTLYNAQANRYMFKRIFFYSRFSYSFFLTD